MIELKLEDDGNKDQAPEVQKIDIWADTSAGYSLGQEAAPVFMDGEVSEEKGKKKRLIFLLGFLIVIGAFWVSEDYLPEGEDPVEFVMSFFTEGLEKDSFEVVESKAVAPVAEVADVREATAAQAPAEQDITGEVTPSSKVGVDSRGVPLNPYWSLPNQLEGEIPSLGRVWSAQEEDSWRAGIMHRFLWQRYRTVEIVKEERLAGSEAIFLEALNESKLWLRMKAVMGLADFGFSVSFAATEKALGDAPTAQVQKFLKRFVKKSTVGERYILRQIIRLVDEKSRRIILAALSKYPSRLRDLYLVAGSYDPGRRVAMWSQKNMPSMKSTDYNHYQGVVLGKEEFVLAESVVTTPSSAPVETNKALAPARNDLLEIENVEIYDPLGDEFKNAGKKRKANQADTIDFDEVI